METLLLVCDKTMKTLVSALVLTAAGASAWASTARPAVSALPLNFEPNRGQAEPSAAFLARGTGYYVTLNSKGSHVILRKGGKAAEIQTRLVGSAAGATLQPLEALPGKSAWFHGSDPSKWITNIPTYSRIEASSVYPGIDLVYYGNQSRLEYDFVVAPGANPSKIRVAYNGAAALRTDAAGNLIVATPAGDLRQEKPVIYQMRNGVRTPVDGSFAIAGKTVGFRVGPYDHSLPLTIDPILVYSSFLGGSDTDEGHAIATDAGSNMYMTGVTYSTPGGDADVLLRKISSDGTTFIYNADLGGSYDDVANGIAVDVNGYAYVGGRTESLDFPTAGSNVFQNVNYDADNAAFVLRVDPTASTLVYSTYVGGSNDDEGYALAIDNSGNAYLTGAASSSDFPISSGAFQANLKGDYDCFVFKIDNQGNAVYSTFIGGGSDDEAFGIAVDNSGNAYITGETYSDNYPQANAPFQHSRHGGYDAFLTELNGDGSGLIFSTFAGGSNDEAGNAVALDPSGNIYVVGTTSSHDFAGTGQGFQPNYKGGASDGFVLKYYAGGSNIAWGSYLGSNGADDANALAVDANGNVYIAGDTNSSAFPSTSDALQGTCAGGFDATLSVLDTNGRNLYFSTFFGGSGDDSFYAIALDPYYNVYLTGVTSSGDITISSSNVVQAQPGGGDVDALLAKISVSSSNIPGASNVGMPVTPSANPMSAAHSVFGRGMVAPNAAGRFGSRPARRSSTDSIQSKRAARTGMKPNR